MSVITFKGNPIHTIGTLPLLGTPAPDFILTKTDLSDLRLNDCLGKKVVFNIFPSLDTLTCAKAMRKFNDLAKKFKNTLLICASADLPFAQKRFCDAEDLQQVLPASSFRHPEFGHRYGVTIMDGPLAGLLSRVVIIFDEKAKIIHTQQVKEIADEPNYEEVLTALSS